MLDGLTCHWRLSSQVNTYCMNQLRPRLLNFLNSTSPTRYRVLAPLCAFYRIFSVHPCCIASLLIHNLEPPISHNHTLACINMSNFTAHIDAIINARNLPSNYLDFPDPATLPTHCFVVVSNVLVTWFPPISLPL